MLRWRALLLAVALGASAVACVVDPAPDRFVVGATPGAEGAVKLRIGSCLAGDLERLVVSVDREEGSEPDTNVLWRLDAEAGGGPHIARAKSVDVTIGTPPIGMIEAAPLIALPSDETVQIDIAMSSQGFSFFFRPDELEADKFALNQTQIDVSDFAGELDGLCS